ncbi:AMP-binding protein [Microbacterium sp. p3-SID338]|uniref:AMP-binding protein n=1 Tax=unclassified Microbacterium TaxID=2609290 RepID=UPI000C8004FF|nr:MULTISPECIES: AMP-binding protein [unclassified Microbacterium]MCT1394888.1 AMP-binding protein [Microbacterium sp. p3-SID338]PMC02065.1 AMP-dependent synthetase [Microbacterium sp. UMB0228]
MSRRATPATEAIRGMRDLLFTHATDYDAARREFAWPDLTAFNFALEWFDVIAGENPDRPAVQIVEADLSLRSWTYGELSARSDQVAAWLRGLGIGRGDHVIVMLNNTIELWEVMLAITKLGAVSIPTSTLLSASDLAYRIEHGRAGAVVTLGTLADRLEGIDPAVLRIGVGASLPADWKRFADAVATTEEFVPDGPTPAGDTALLYFTSGTTNRPKLVQHTHVSYPVGHLSTMWWLGVRPDDVHLNISSPGWAKHAWSSFYSPFLAEATVFVYNYDRFDANTLMEVMDTHHVSTFCAPPTVWRMLIQADLSRLAHPPRELVGAGEPLNPEVIDRVREAWGGTIRDGFGQTEMTACIGNSPGQTVKVGSMGRPLPGYPVVLLDPSTGEVVEDEGEIALDLAQPPLGLMAGYYDDPEKTAESRAGGFHHTGDIAVRDADGYLTYIGRSDDVFKASDYKISPFELESVLLEHDLVVEAAVIPSPDPTRLAVPKAYVCLTPDAGADEAAAARAVFGYAHERLSSHLWVRIIEFVPELPKTISGKIRRVELRARESARVAAGDEARQHRDRDYR